jgi:hypothetical protein
MCFLFFYLNFVNFANSSAFGLSKLMLLLFILVCRIINGLYTHYLTYTCLTLGNLCTVSYSVLPLCVALDVLATMAIQEPICVHTVPCPSYSVLNGYNS